jgi:hypothetical protein
MKKFITFTIMLILAFSLQFTAKAQYAYNPVQVDTVKVSPNQMFNYIQLPEYQAAKEKSDKGRKMFYGGLITQMVGAGLVILTADQMASSSYTTSSSGPASWSGPSSGSSSSGDSAKFGYIMGWGAVAVGGILEIAGVVKWVEGSSEMHDLRIMYSPARIVVAF